MRAPTGDFHLRERRGRKKRLEQPEDPGEGGWYVHKELVREELRVVVREDVRDLARSSLRVRVAAIPAYTFVVLTKAKSQLLG